jgi:hypothetical protein
VLQNSRSDYSEWYPLMARIVYWLRMYLRVFIDKCTRHLVARVFELKVLAVLNYTYTTIAVGNADKMLS